jgi:hypothetical protein
MIRVRAVRACRKVFDHARDQGLHLGVVTKKFDSFLCDDVGFYELHNIREAKANIDMACDGGFAMAIDDVVKNQVRVERTTETVHRGAPVRTR